MPENCDVLIEDLKREINFVVRLCQHDPGHERVLVPLVNAAYETLLFAECATAEVPREEVAIRLESAIKSLL